jgi:hypothetical protein
VILIHFTATPQPCYRIKSSPLLILEATRLPLEVLAHEIRDDRVHARRILVEVEVVTTLRVNSDLNTLGSGEEGRHVVFDEAIAVSGASEVIEFADDVEDGTGEFLAHGVDAEAFLQTENLL